MQLATVQTASFPTSRRVASKWLVLFATSLGVFMGSLDATVVNVAFPAMARSYPGTSHATLSWVLNGYTIAFAALLIVGGRTADRFGRRRVFFAGMAVFTFGSALCGFAATVGTLVAGRIVQGVGAAAMIPASLGLLLAAFPGNQRATAVALWGVFSALSIAAGPTLGAALVEGPGWHWVFFVNIPVAVFAFALGRLVLTDSKDVNARSAADFGGVLLITAAMASLALGIVEGGEWGWGSARVVAAFAIAVALVAAFVWRGLRHEAPVVDLRLFRVRSFAVANSVMVVYSTAFFALMLGNILFLTSVWQYSVMRAGLAVTPAPIAAALAAPIAGRRVSRAGFRPIVVGGLLVTAASLVWLALRASAHPDYLGVWLPANVVLGLGVGSCFSLISGAAVSSLQPAELGVGSAVNQTARQAGSIVGVALLVAILGTPANVGQALTNFQHAWWLSAALSGLAALLAMGLGGALGKVNVSTGPVEVPSSAATVDAAA